RVDSRLIIAAAIVRSLPGIMHLSEVFQFGRTFDVDRAPDARLSSRTEADRVAVLIETLAHSIDPAEAEGLIDGLLPRDRRLARSLFVEADQKLGLLVVILLEPFPELLGGCEKRRPHDFRG